MRPPCVASLLRFSIGIYQKTVDLGNCFPTFLVNVGHVVTRFFKGAGIATIVVQTLFKALERQVSLPSVANRTSRSEKVRGQIYPSVASSTAVFIHFFHNKKKYFFYPKESD